MNHTLQFSIAIGIIGLLAIAACNNKSYNDVNAGSNVSFSQLKSTPQTITVNAGQDMIVYGASGTMLHFYNNSFQDASGKVITSGTVSVQLTEMYKPGDMIRNAATTLSNGQILQSGGEINISATMNGQTVYANAYGLGFPHAAASTQPMALFYGSTNPANNSNSVTTWTQSDTTKSGTTCYNANSGFYYFDSCKNFTFANCDWFYRNDSPETTVSVILPDTSFNASNTYLYLVLPNITIGRGTDTFNAVLSNAGNWTGSSNYNAATNTLQLISEGNKTIVPAGLKYEFVVIACKKSNYYYFEQSGIVSDSGINVKAVMSQTTQQQIISQLNGL